jgi:hypothetical protein
LIRWTHYTTKAETAVRQQEQQQQQALDEAYAQEERREAGRCIVELLREISPEVGSEMYREPFALDAAYIDQLLEENQRMYSDTGVL